jgi:hypothetical protein
MKLSQFYAHGHEIFYFSQFNRVFLKFIFDIKALKKIQNKPEKK